MLRFTKKTESGRSMIEIIGVLAIMAIISAAAFVLIRSAMATQRRNQVVNDFMNIASGVRTLFADYDNLETMAGLTGTSVLSAIGIDIDNTPYNGAFYDVHVDVEDATYQYFVVSISNLPTRDCNALNAMDWPGASSDSEGTCNGNDNQVSVEYKK